MDHIDKMEKIRVIAEQGVVALTTNKVTTSTVFATLMANMGGLMTKENAIFFLSATLIITQIAANIYKSRLYKRLSKQEFIDIDPEEVEKVVTKRKRRTHKR